MARGPAGSLRDPLAEGSEARLHPGVHWSRALPESPGIDLVPPMLIDWHEPDRTRLAGLVAQGVAEAVPRARIAGVAVACRDPRAAALWFRQALGLKAVEAATRSYGKAMRIGLQGGDVFLCGGKDAPATVQEVLERRGERPFAVHFSALRESVGGETSIGGSRYTFEPL